MALRAELFKNVYFNKFCLKSTMCVWELCGTGKPTQKKDLGQIAMTYGGRS